MTDQPPTRDSQQRAGSASSELEPAVESGTRRGLVGVGGVFDLFHDVERTMNPNDVVMTPPDIAKAIVDRFKPSGRTLDPCRGNGAFWSLMPGAEWCEINQGRDFLRWTERVDWIVSNPPYSTFFEFLAHSFQVADNVVYAIPVAKIFQSIPYLEMIAEYGGIREIMVLGRGRAVGLPLGFAVGAVHFKRGYKGETRIALSSGGGGAELGENARERHEGETQND